MVELGFERGLSDPNSWKGPREAAHSQEPLGTRGSVGHRGEREEGRCSRSSLRGWKPSRCQPARLAGSCRHLTGLVSKQECHHGNHCQGICSLVCTGAAWMWMRVAAFLGVGDGRGRKQADSVPVHCSQTPPTARGAAQNIPES